jgi:hypothetical protein
MIEIGGLNEKQIQLRIKYLKCKKSMFEKYKPKKSGIKNWNLTVPENKGTTLNVDSRRS